MKKNYFLGLLAIAALAAGCSKGGGQGELIGVQGRKKFKPEMPHGMVYIPAGTFVMGQTDQDIAASQIAQNKQVTIAAFYMDETEITNNEYRQFVSWVRDSIAHTKLGHFQTAKGGNAPASATQNIDWKKPLPWSGKKSKAEGDAAQLDEMYYQGDDQIFDRKEINVSLLKYRTAELDLTKAAAARGDKTKKRSDFIVRDTVEVYPDTLVWLSDFTYAANEPMVQGYFSHPAFDDYPVVGVTWRQARAFAHWRTKINADYKRSRKMPERLPYELPSEAEFEYAARGGKVGTIYPWGGPYIRNAKGCMNANFKPGRGNYAADGGYYTVHVRSYFPNDYGLYNMAGNVSEWTSSSFDESASTFVHDFNPTLRYNAGKDEPENVKRKVVKGGSWKDIGFFLQNGTRSYEFQDTAKSYIGFRLVTRFLGRDINDKNQRN